MATPVSILEPERRRSAAPVLAQVVAAAILGLIALPAGFGDASASGGGTAAFWQDVAWGALGLLVALWLLVIRTPLTQLVTVGVVRLTIGDERRHPRLAEVTEAAPRVATWLVVTGYLVLIQGIIRRPFVRVLSASFDQATVDAAFGAVVLTLLLVTLWLLYRAGRKLVEATVWSALDAVVATTGSERTELAETLVDEATQPGRGGSTVRDRATTRPGTEDERTRPAPPVGSDAPTMAAPGSAEPAAATVLDVNSDATVRDPRGVGGRTAAPSGAEDATIAAAAPDSASTESTAARSAVGSVEETQVAPPDAAATIGRVSPADDATIADQSKSNRSDTNAVTRRVEGGGVTSEHASSDATLVAGEGDERTIAFDASDATREVDARDDASDRSRSSKRA